MATTSILEQYRIADFLEWNDRKQLVLNPYFQRRSVWTQQAKAALIDTILRRLPIPKVYMRTKINSNTKTAIREIVDGQQRLRSIFEFAEDKFALGPRCKEFAGLRYSALTEELKEAFLTYPVAVDQLINATDTDVLEVFSRLNSYTATLVPAEKRHARYYGPFKLAVHDAARDAEVLWSKFEIVSVRERVRMADESLMAELFGVVLRGVTDGGAKAIEKLYKDFDRDFPQEEETRRTVDNNIAFLVDSLGDVLLDTPFARSAQFLMLFAAVTHLRSGIPAGQLGERLPLSPRRDPGNLDEAKANLRELASVLDADEAPQHHQAFWAASKGTTHRISSRGVRFLEMYQALAG